jgi:hypothetical protein
MVHERLGIRTFQRDESSGTFRPLTTDPTFAPKLCHPCHTRGTKARDFVYTS